MRRSAAAAAEPRSRGRRACRLLAALLTLAAIWPAEPARAQETALIRVNPSVGRDIGGYTDVQRVFGMFWGGNVPREARPKLQRLMKDLNFNAGRAIFNGWVGGQPDVYAAWHGREPAFDTWEESYRWWDQWMRAIDPDAFWMERFHSPPRAAGYMDGSTGSDYDLIVACHLALFDGRCARNPEAAARHFAAVARAVKAHGTGAGIRLRFLQPCNEPNSKHYISQFRNPPEDPEGEIKTAAAVDAYTRTFNVAFRHMKREHPDVTVVGTCPGWQAAFYYDGPGNAGNQSNWLMWAKRFIDGLDDPEAIDYYNYHAYSTPVSTHLAYMGLTRNYAWLKHGRRPRSIVTEAGYFPGRRDALPPAEEWRERFLHTLEDIFMMLERPDVFAMRHQFFAYGIVDGPWASHNTISVRPDGSVEPQATYWALWAMKDTRGRMLASATDSPGIRTFACAPAGDRIAVSIYNPTDEAVAAAVDSGWQGTVRAVGLRYAAFDREKGNCSAGEIELPAAPAVRVDVPPCSIQNVTFHLDAELRIAQAERMREYFGNRTAVELDGRQTIRIPVQATAPPRRATLRLAFQRLIEEGSGRVSLNGRDLTFDWADAPRSFIDYANWLPREAGWIGIPVDTATLDTENVLVVEPMENQRLFYAALELAY